MLWRTDTASSCGMYAQLVSCDPCVRQELGQCCDQLQFTLIVFGSLQERVRCFVFFFGVRVNCKLHVDVVYCLPMVLGVSRCLQERIQCWLVWLG